MRCIRNAKVAQPVALGLAFLILSPVARLNGQTSAALRDLVEKRLAVPENGGNVCSAASVTLAGAHTRIVASVDWSGRGFCNEVWVINPAQDHSEDQHFDAWKVQDVNKLIIGQSPSAGMGLAIPRGYSPYNGAGCMATWTTVYGESGGKLVDRSDNFREFYQIRLKTLEDRLNRGDQEPACAQMEADKIQRFLGLSPTAGFDRALQWVQSSDASLRAKGVAVLGDIGDQPSKQELEKVAAGDSPEATLARHYLNRDAH